MILRIGYDLRNKIDYAMLVIRGAQYIVSQYIISFHYTTKTIKNYILQF